MKNPMSWKSHQMNQSNDVYSLIQNKKINKILKTRRGVLRAIDEINKEGRSKEVGEMNSGKKFFKNIFITCLIEWQAMTALLNLA